MRHHVLFGIACVDGRFEYFYALAGELGSFQSSDQFFGLAGEHGTADDFNPSSAHHFPVSFGYRTHVRMFLIIILCKNKN